MTRKTLKDEEVLKMIKPGVWIAAALGLFSLKKATDFIVT